MQHQSSQSSSGAPLLPMSPFSEAKRNKQRSIASLGEENTDVICTAIQISNLNVASKKPSTSTAVTRFLTEVLSASGGSYRLWSH